MGDTRRREEIPGRYRWDLTPLFESDDEWQTSYERYERRVNRLSFEEGVADDSEALLRALERRDELHALGSRLSLYAECHAWTDVTDETARARVRRVERLDAKRDATLQDLESAVRGAGRERIDAMTGERPELGRYAHYLDDVFRRATRTPEPAVDATVGALEESLDAPARTLRTVADRAFDPPTVADPDGDEVRLTRVARHNVIVHPDREYRRRAYEAYRDALRENREVAAQAYVDHVRSHAARASVRNEQSVLAASMDGLVPPSTVEALVEQLREHREPFCRRYERLRERLDVDELRPWDLRAPLTDADGADIPYDEATDIVAEAVAPLGDDYRERLVEFLDGRRVDVYPTDRKRDVPAVMFGENGTEPFVHLNYGANLESLYLFAHELAHVMHYLLAAAAQPRAYQRLSWHVGELPSFLHELLLTDHLLESDRVADEAVLDVALGRLPPLAPGRGVAFTREIVERVEADEELTADDIDALWRETGEEFFDPVGYADDDGHRWLNLNLDRDPFHAVWYLLGRTSALATARHLRAGDLEVETYREFLRAGESAYPMDLLEMLALDVGSGSVVETAAEEYGRLVDAL